MKHAEIRKRLHGPRKRPVAGPPIKIDPCPYVRPSGTYQTLQLCGDLDFKVGGADVQGMNASGLLDLRGSRMFISAWLENSYVSSAEVIDFKFDGLDIPVRDGLSRALRVRFSVRMKDDTTGITKTYPVDEAAVILTPLVDRTGTASSRLGSDALPSLAVQLQNPFDNTVVDVNLRAKNAVHVTLGPSAMERVAEYNEALDALSRNIMQQSEYHQCRVPKDAKPFLSGMTALSSGGVPELNTGAVKTHYGVLSSLFQNVDRSLPVTLLVHYLANALFQSGKSLKTVNELPSCQFAQFVGRVISGLTLSADAYVYQSDCTAALGFNLGGVSSHLGSQGGTLFKLTPKVSENIGLPFDETSFLGRDKPGPVAQAPGLYACRDVPALAKLAHSQEWECESCVLGNDDCETSASGAKLATASIQRHPWDLVQVGSYAGLSAEDEPEKRYNTAWVKSELSQCQSTKDLQDGCIHECCRFFSRAKGMLVSGELSVDLLVCLASSAQPASGSGLSRPEREPEPTRDPEEREPEPDETEEELGDEGVDTDDGGPEDLADPENAFGGGHCCAALRWRDPASVDQLVGDAESDTPTMHVEILEGTTACKPVHVTTADPLFSLHENWHSPQDPPLYKEVALNVMLSYLSQFLSSATKISNCQPGDSYTSGFDEFGWHGPQKIPGYVRDTMVMNHLHCLHKAPKEASTIPFYRWMMYTGWACDANGVGCMPVNEEGCGKTAGCRPCNLVHKDLRAFSADMAPEHNQLGRDIFEEVMPPIASKKTLHEYALDHYKPLKSICDINASLEADLEPGVRYETVASMEAPGSLALLDLYFKAKATLIDSANRINAVRPDSDGFTCDVGEYMKNIVVVLNAPCTAKQPGEPIKVTYISSLCQAAVQHGWPGVERWYHGGIEAGKKTCGG